MPVQMKAIVPRRAVVPFPAHELRWRLRDWAADTVHEMQAYPPWQPWKRAPKSGVRAGGKRTGSLGRSWGYNLRASSATVGTNLRYAGYVQGYRARGLKNERQTRSMARRGWQSISDVAEFTWRKHLDGIQAVFRRH